MGNTVDSSFQQRRVRVSFQLATGSFNKNGDPDSVVFEDHRIRAEIQMQGGDSMPSCRLSIFGLSKETMDRLTVINYTNMDFMRNSVTVEATDNEGHFIKIFVGEIFQSMPDYMGAPDVPFVVEAYGGMIGALQKSFAVGYPGARKVSEIMQVIAKELNLELENNGVESTITDQYLSGSPVQKLKILAASANIQFWYLPEEGVLAIAPAGAPREKYQPVKFNAELGLVGWPSKLHVGISFTSLFRPQVCHGAKILMESSVPACNGEWYIISMNHRIDGNTPGGAWFSDIEATPANVFIMRR